MGVLENKWILKYNKFRELYGHVCSSLDSIRGREVSRKWRSDLIEFLEAFFLMGPFFRMRWDRFWAPSTSFSAEASIGSRSLISLPLERTCVIGI